MNDSFDDNKVAHPTHAALKRQQNKEEMDWPRIGTASVDQHGSAFIYIHKMPEEQVSIALRPLAELEKIRAEGVEKPNLHRLHDTKSLAP